jgi:16S rRNA U1498 N3-methylase RsmE
MLDKDKINWYCLAKTRRMNKMEEGRKMSEIEFENMIDRVVVSGQGIKSLKNMDLIIEKAKEFGYVRDKI